MGTSITDKDPRPFPERYVTTGKEKRTVSQAVELLEFKMLKHTGLLVRVLWDTGVESSWLEARTVPVFRHWQGHTAAYTTTYA